MIHDEKPYEFRKRMLQVNQPGAFDQTVHPLANEIVIKSSTIMSIPNDTVVYTAARDFMDFMLVSMQTPTMLAFDERVEERKAEISVRIDRNYRTYKCYQITVDHSGIKILAHDNRGAAQALFRLEDRMLARHAPFLAAGVEEREPLYSPRMIHSGYGLDLFPNEYLLKIAKAGMDAIVIYVSGINRNSRGYMDFNELIYRAALYGLDVYAYSDMRVFVHPEEPDARTQFDRAYGELFRECPGFKGVVLVGESVGFPTHDPNAAPCPYFKNRIDGIPTGKPSADMWPCSDYAEWVTLIRNVIFAQKPDADIVFWTYNWGCAPKEYRLRLIRSLPKDISLLVTYEMFQKYPIGDAIGHCSDYTLAFEGPGEYFISEAEEAKKNGLRLYAMTNTGGLTWDMGVIPYEPMPFQWIKRYRTMRKSQDKWGLCGLMESHHYGFWPSFVSEIAKEAFERGGEDCDTAFEHALQRHFGAKAVPEITQALKLWSEAITYYIPSNENQGGAFRIGPAYPFNLTAVLRQEIPFPSDVDFTFPQYRQDNVGLNSLSAVRVRAEERSLERMLSLMKEGQVFLENIPEKNEETEYLVNFGRFLVCYVQTGIHAMKWHICISRLKIEWEEGAAEKLIEEADAILCAEYANVEAAMLCVQKDSRLGWEPRQEYRCGPKQLAWKLRQIEYVRNTELSAYRKSLNMTLASETVVADYFP